MVESLPDREKTQGVIPSTEGKKGEGTCLKAPSTATQTAAKGPGVEIFNTGRPWTQTASEADCGRFTHGFVHQLYPGSGRGISPGVFQIPCPLPWGARRRKVLTLAGCLDTPPHSRKPTWVLHSEEATTIFSRCRGKLWWAAHFSFCFILSRT